MNNGGKCCISQDILKDHIYVFLPFTTFTDVKKGSRYEEIAFIRDC